MYNHCPLSAETDLMSQPVELLGNSGKYVLKEAYGQMFKHTNIYPRCNEDRLNAVHIRISNLMGKIYGYFRIVSRLICR
jgi:hypothetical protein